VEKDIARRLLAHYRRGRRDLPWRRTRDPYAIWVSEVMLQQTRVETVIPYFERWMVRFPTVRALADAPLDDVLSCWAGLGYYARARSLHRAAREVVDRLHGVVPDDAEGLRALPGVGRYTAGAIASIAFGRREPVVDGNVARVYARLFGIEDDVKSVATLRRLWDLAARIVPARAPGDFNQALMELGATICTPRSPACASCPLAATCVARRDGRQDELPLVARKKAAKRVGIDAALVVRGGRWLLARRAAEGLFGGLWELPELGALAGAVPLGEPVAEHVHQLTHRTIRYRVFRAELAGPPRAGAPYDATRFTSPATLPSLGVSSATLKLAESLRSTEWPTPKAR
jgi:A/G-specific adenine glycosylase